MVVQYGQNEIGYHWKQRQYDLFSWWRGVSLNEMENYLRDAFGESETGPDSIRLRLHGEWPDEEI